MLCIMGIGQHWVALTGIMSFDLCASIVSSDRCYCLVLPDPPFLCFCWKGGGGLFSPPPFLGVGEGVNNPPGSSADAMTTCHCNLCKFSVSNIDLSHPVSMPRQTACQFKCLLCSSCEEHTWAGWSTSSWVYSRCLRTLRRLRSLDQQ